MQFKFLEKNPTKFNIYHRLSTCISQLSARKSTITKNITLEKNKKKDLILKFLNRKWGLSALYPVAVLEI